jgi:hypothetical protein
VPIDAVPGSYSLEWSKTGDDYEKDIEGDEVYSPIPTTTIIVTDEKSDIHVSEVSNVVAPGRGFHISVTLENPPNNQIYIIPSIISDID